MSLKTISLVTSSVAVFFVTFMSSSLNIALPVISREFHTQAILLSWIVSSFVLAAAVFSIPFGRIADIIGIKKTFLFGAAIYTTISAVAVFANSSIMLIVCRSIQGVGASIIAITAVSLLTMIYPASERGRALGISIACVYAGSATGPFLGGILTEHLGWRSIFVVNIPAGLAVILVLLWKIKGEWCECKGERFDYTGSIIYGLALIALMYGFSLLPQALGGILILAGVIGLLIFIRWEGRSKSPILDPGIFRDNRAFLFSNLAALTTYSAIFAVGFLISLYLQYNKGLNPEQAGLILIAQPVIQTILSPFTGRLSDKIEPRIVASLGMALICIGLLLFAFLSPDTSRLYIMIALVVLGMGFALFSSPNSNAIMSSVTPRF